MLRLKGKRALVTGSGQGLGEHMAHALAREGCEIVGFEVRPKLLDEATTDLRNKGFCANGHLVDVRDFQAVHDAVEKVYRECGPVDILVNNAGKASANPSTN